MSVDTDVGAWVVPPLRAVWVPAGVEHEIRMTGHVKMRSLYFEPGVASFPKRCVVVSVSPLLRELVVHAVAHAPLVRGHLVGLLLEQLDELPTVPLHLPMPADNRARRIAELLLVNPADARSLGQLASGASRRTIERLFVSETSLTFGQWRTQARLMHALRLLAAGESVTRVGLEVGYESTSAFVAMFKRALGNTPGRYYLT